MHIDPYEHGLLAALFLTGASTVALIAALALPRARRGLRNTSVATALLGAGCLLISAAWHVTREHGRETLTPRGMIDFFGEHPVYLGIGAAAVAALVVSVVLREHELRAEERRRAAAREEDA